MNNIKTSLSLFLVFACMFLFIGCKKDNKYESAQNKTSKIYGTVVDISNSEPINGVAVGVFVGDDIITSVIGGADGYYEIVLGNELFKNSNNMHIVAIAGHVGYYDDYREIDVILGTDYNLDFFLEPGEE